MVAQQGTQHAPCPGLWDVLINSLPYLLIGLFLFIFVNSSSFESIIIFFFNTHPGERIEKVKNTHLMV